MTAPAPGLFAGTRVLVTGSTQGIGETLAHGFAAAGADLVVTGRNADRLADQVEALTTTHGVRCTAVVADLAALDGPTQLADAAWAAYDGLDVVVNNAGVSYPEPVVDVTPTAWDATMAVNLRAPALLSAVLGRRMARGGGGRIVNISSAAGTTPLTEHYAYSASKAGLVMATRVLALELGPLGVTANVVAPTVVMTDMGQRVWGDEQKAAPLLARVPVGRFAEPHEVVSAVLYLASPDAAMVNGVVLPVDGGYAAV